MEQNQLVAKNAPMGLDLMYELPDLSKAKAAAIELTGEYWTPEKEGEVKRLFFNEIRQELTIDFASGADVELSVAYFVEVKDGDKRVIRQASKRLVGALEMLKTPSGMPLEITYTGKKKNKTNSFMSDSWSIKPLFLDGQVKNENVIKETIGFDAGAPDGDHSTTVHVNAQTGEIIEQSKTPGF
ncbi:hypothetical protein FACS189426_06240 [Bacteroidia bacterium]|nr:hypothetical protein FACS189426_06240 [Bacteroidia bacterium]GHV71225.1 hypothetical protein FACS189420_5530 [Bacteroidia bacterium]